MKANRFRFRAWDRTTKAWVNGWMEDREPLVSSTPSWEGYIGIEQRDVVVECQGNRVIVMQSTGLTDKNGVEIFEGDVVRHNGQVCEIVYDDSAMGFAYKGLAPWLCRRIKAGGNCEEVIGNVHENPELLES